MRPSAKSLIVWCGPAFAPQPPQDRNGLGIAHAEAVLEAAFDILRGTVKHRLSGEGVICPCAARDERLELRSRPENYGVCSSPPVG